MYQLVHHTVEDTNVSPKYLTFVYRSILCVYSFS
jgi:hypothetical protein